MPSPHSNEAPNNPNKVQKRYEQERDKRLRDDGTAQYIDIFRSEKFRNMQEDLWVDASTIQDARTMFPKNRCPILILGAGLGGLLYAVRMIQKGVSPKDIRMVDIAGGFGGTWYYNRYPGLTCDLEAYCYMPLLEEMNYMPKHRYASGEEIRNYANLIAERFELTDKVAFQTKAEKLVWDEVNKEWQVELVQRRKQSQTLNIRSQFVVLTNGTLSLPKLPGIPGILEYQGDIFHSSRWDYSITGGSPDDPSLQRLKEKRVAIIGTGASAVQAIPFLARWSKHLYVVQRTPSSVDIRGQRATDPEWFQNEVANSKGWQRKRNKNFNQQFTTGERPTVNLVDDELTRALGVAVIAGNPVGPLKAEELPAYIRSLQDIDLPRMNRIRDRVQQTVKDSNVAEKLKPWYPTWCKRPCFNDQYLQAFNKDNVTLLDTAGKGMDRLTSDSIVVNGQSYAVDLVIFSTGFNAPYVGTPAEKANASIIGRDGLSMTEKWARNGPTTLHAVLDQNFPNLFLSGPWQGAASANALFNVDCLAQHAAYILTTAKRRFDGEKAFAIAPTSAAVEDWAAQIVKRSVLMAVMMGCTPGFFNQEGEIDKVKPEDQMKAARGGIWGTGLESFLEYVESWRAGDSMEGIELRT